MMPKANKVLMVLGAATAIAIGAIGGAVYTRQTRPQPQGIDYLVETPATIAVQASGATVPDFRAAAKKILPSIVSITTLTEGENWFGERFIEPSGSGSGVVISKSGYIVTNNHVVTNGGRRMADKIMVKFHDSKSEEATLVGTDPRADIAVLKVKRQDITPVTMGDSSTLEPGEWAIAAGNPLGFEQTISVGVVSSLGRPLRSQDYAVFVDGIQTDAAINQGNSGGALCDSKGHLVGINTMIASTDQGSVGIGFAIPVNRVQKVVNDLVKFGHAKYGRIGLAVRNDSSVLSVPAARRQLMQIVGTTVEPPSKGILIQQVYSNGPADRAGLRRWDVVTSINGKAMAETMDYQVYMSDKKPGEVLSLQVWSAGTQKTIKVTLDEATE